MLQFQDQLYLIQTHGLPAEAVRLCAMEKADAGRRLYHPQSRQRLLLDLQAQGYARRGGVRWPERRQVNALAERIDKAGLRLAWRGQTGYPKKLEHRLGVAAPAWVWIAGPTQRLKSTACAIIGSRQTPEPLLAATHRLARALSEAGIAVVSGLAPGADSAAHAGAMRGEAGTVAIPSRGLTGVDLGPCRGDEARMTCMGLDRPDTPFNAGLAIRRNTMIAAMAEGIVLAASGAKGGSMYAVRWAIDHGLPMWAFDVGAATSVANRHLIESGFAQPLAVGADTAEWIGAIEISLATPRIMHAVQPTTAVGQLDWLS